MRATPSFSPLGMITITNVTTTDYIQSVTGFSVVSFGGKSSVHLRFYNFVGLSANSTYLARNGDMYISCDAEL